MNYKQLGYLQLSIQDLFVCVCNDIRNFTHKRKNCFLHFFS